MVANKKFLDAIAHHEGFYLPGSVAQRLNNPGNITAGVAKYYNRYVDTWKNPVTGIVFAVYAKIEDGWADLNDYIVETISGEWRNYRREASARSKRTQDLTLAEYFGVYAPIGWENWLIGKHKPNTVYAASVSKLAKIPINIPMGQLIQDAAIEEHQDAPTIPLQYYWQRNKRYAALKLGNSSLSFQNNSCYTVCLAYLVGKDPLEVHKTLKAAGCYSGANIINEKAAKVLGLQYLGKETNVNNGPDWSPSIKEVLLGKSQHFVVRLIDKSNPLASSYGTFIFDPWEGEYKQINFYPFKSYRLFKK